MRAWSSNVTREVEEASRPHVARGGRAGGTKVWDGRGGLAAGEEVQPVEGKIKGPIEWWRLNESRCPVFSKLAFDLSSN